jgi:hypothetical protein
VGFASSLHNSIGKKAHLHAPERQARDLHDDPLTSLAPFLSLSLSLSLCISSRTALSDPEHGYVDNVDPVIMVRFCFVLAPRCTARGHCPLAGHLHAQLQTPPCCAGRPRARDREQTICCALRATPLTGWMDCIGPMLFCGPSVGWGA